MGRNEECCVYDFCSELLLRKLLLVLEQVGLTLNLAVVPKDGVTKAQEGGTNR